MDMLKLSALGFAAMIAASSCVLAQGGTELPSNAKGAQQKEGQGAASGSTGGASTSSGSAASAPSSTDSGRQTGTGGNPGGAPGRQ